MAGDWIKMGTGLRRHPKVVRIASALQADRLRAVGGLHAVWCVFDEHSADGLLAGYTAEIMDEEIGFPGFSRAMQAVGWLEISTEGLRVPEYEEHNGPTAKRRALDSKRKSAAREAGTADESDPADPSESSPQTVRAVSASHADKMTTREEKRREERKKENTPQPPELFDRFWAVYPKKRNRGDAEKAWLKLKPDEPMLARILEAVEVAKRRDDWRKEGGQFVPYPASWLNAKGWMDEPDSGGSSANQTSAQFRVAGGFVP